MPSSGSYRYSQHNDWKKWYITHESPKLDLEFHETHHVVRDGTVNVSAMDIQRKKHDPGPRHDTEIDLYLLG